MVSDDESGELEKAGVRTWLPEPKGRGWKLVSFVYLRRPHEPVAAVVWACAILGVALLPFLAIWLIWLFLSALGTLSHSLASEQASAEAAKNILLAVGAAVAAPFVIWRTWIAHQQWLVGKEQSDTQIKTMQSGLLTKAIEQLGAMREEKISHVNDDGSIETRTETVPNLEVRLGAIYLLKRLAEDSDRDHIPILETLCAYVRENSRQEWRKWSREEAKRRGMEVKAGEEVLLLDPVTEEKGRIWIVGDYALHATLRDLAPIPRVDIQSALAVIGDVNLGARRDQLGKKAKLSLRNAFIPRAEMNGFRLEGVSFEGAHCEHIQLRGANCRDADFSDAHCQCADLREAQFQRVKFNKTQCQGARFFET